MIVLSRACYSRPREEVELTTASEQTTPASSILKPKKSEPHEKVLKGATPNRLRRQEAEPVLDHKLSADAELLLEFISRHPGMFVTQIYKELRLSGYKGDRLKEQLVEFKRRPGKEKGDVWPKFLLSPDKAKKFSKIHLR